MFVALGIQHAMRMRHILSYASCLPVPYFPILFHKRRDFRENNEDKMCVWIFSTVVYKLFVILRRVERDMVIDVHTYSCKVSVIFIKF